MDAESEDFKTGALLNACSIDLPPGDVVESVEFERFFRLNLVYGDVQGPMVLNFESAVEDDRGPDGSPEGPELRAVPLSQDATSWARLRRGLPQPVRQGAAAGEFDAADPLQIGSLPLALYLPFQQEWRLNGYTRGRMVNAFSLGPGEEQSVEVFTWDRRTRSLESTTALESEQVSESSGSRRDALDVSTDVSKQSGFELTSGGKVGFTVGVVNANINAGMTARTGVNDAEKQTRGSIVEATTHSTSRIRTTRTLKVSETAEIGRESRVTRTLRNVNTCHTLTIPFFEILANYCVSTMVRTERIQLVVLIPSAKLIGLSGFNRQSVRLHETALRLALLDRELEGGFAAARLLDARDRACNILCTGCSCGDDVPGGGPSAEWNAVLAAANAVADSARVVRSTFVRFPGSLIEASVGLGGGVQDVERYLFMKAMQAHAPRLVVDLEGIGIAGGGGQVSAAQVQSLAQVIAAIPADARAKLSLDESVSSSVSNEIYWYAFTSITFEFIAAGIFLAAVKSHTNDLRTYDDAGLMSAIAAFSVAYDAWSKVQTAEAQRNERLAELARIAKEERQQRILSTFSLYETATAEERLQALLDHLNDPRNIDHYRFAVWNERAATDDESVMTLALAGFVDPTPVGIVGDQLAVPVRLDKNPQLGAFFTDSIADLVERPIRDERRHILPTAALYAESIVGQCCSCEPEQVKRQQLDIDRLRLANELTELEADRLRARLHAHPPVLDNPLADPPVLQVEIARHRHAPHPDGAESADGQS